MDANILNVRGGKTVIDSSISHYARMGIDIEILELDGNTAKIKIAQNRLKNGYILNQKQLVERAKEVFEPTGLKIKVVPVAFSLDVDFITPQWIKRSMLEYGIKTNDIIKQLAFDKSTLSLYLSGKRKMNKSVRSAFFFYFLTYELNRDLREQLNTM